MTVEAAIRAVASTQAVADVAVQAWAQDEAKLTAQGINNNQRKAMLIGQCAHEGAVGKVFRGATGAVSAFWISGFAFWVGILSLFWPKIRFLGGLAPGITLLRSGFYPRQAQPAASGYVQ